MNGRLLCSEIRAAWREETHLLAKRIVASKLFFYRTCEVFNDDDAKFSPAEGMLSVHGHISQVTQTISAYVHHLFKPYEVGAPTAFEPQSDWTSYGVDEALSKFDHNMNRMRGSFSRLSEAEAAQRLGQNGVLPDYFTYVDALEVVLDLSAHHRGALAQYARLLGRDPKLPYLDISERLTEQNLL